MLAPGVEPGLELRQLSETPAQPQAAKRGSIVDPAAEDNGPSGIVRGGSPIASAGIGDRESRLSPGILTGGCALADCESPSATSSSVSPAG